MTRRLFVTFIVVPSLFASAAGFVKQKPTKSTIPLSMDEIGVYKIVLRQYASKEHESLNITATTFPLDPSFPSNSLSDNECLKGIQLDNLASTSRSFHDIPPEVLTGKMKLVDPKKQAKVLASSWQKLEAWRKNSGTNGKQKSLDELAREVSDGGWLCLSEIAFDKEHRFALVAYRYLCGFLCGSGATVVLEKVNGEWKTSDRICSSWIS
jgi:hypothetical protein